MRSVYYVYFFLIKFFLNKCCHFKSVGISRKNPSIFKKKSLAYFSIIFKKIVATVQRITKIAQ